MRQMISADVDGGSAGGGDGFFVVLLPPTLPPPPPPPLLLLLAVPLAAAATAAASPCPLLFFFLAMLLVICCPTLKIVYNLEGVAGRCSCASSSNNLHAKERAPATRSRALLSFTHHPPAAPLLCLCPLPCCLPRQAPVQLCSALLHRTRPSDMDKRRTHTRNCHG